MFTYYFHNFLWTRTSMLEFRIEPSGNSSFLARVVNKSKDPRDDDLGALYYVVIVILIYACSIVMMIASHIRKNKMDRRLNAYLKEMAFVRKKERQMQLVRNSLFKKIFLNLLCFQLNATAKFAARQDIDEKCMDDARTTVGIQCSNSEGSCNEERSFYGNSNIGSSQKLFGFVAVKELNCLTPESCRKYNRKPSMDYKNCMDPDSESIFMESTNKISDTEEEGSDEILLENSLP